MAAWPIGYMAVSSAYYVLKHSSAGVRANKSATLIFRRAVLGKNKNLVCTATCPFHQFANW